MKLIELLKNDDIEITFAGVCECGEPKYDVCLNKEYYTTIHKNILLKYNDKFRRDSEEYKNER